MRALTLRLIHAPGLVLTVAAALTLGAVLAGLGLPFITARSAMLPQHLPEARRFNAFLTNFGAANDLVIVLEGDAGAAPDRAALDRFAEGLAERLQAAPEIRSVARGVGLDVLGPLAWLLAPRAALDAAAGPARALAAGLPRAWGPALDAGATALGEGLSPPPGVAPEELVAALDGLSWLLADWRRWLTAPQIPEGLDLTGLLAPHGAAEAADGAFRSRDGRLAFLFARPVDPSEELSVVGPFVAAARAAAAAEAAAWEAAGLRPPTVGLAGLPAVIVEEFDAIQGDLKLIVLTSAGLILLLILLGLRSLRRALVIFIPMGVGVAWNLGLTWLVVGHLTVLTSSFTAILFGLGVDYGILLSARILEERARGVALDDAIADGTAAALRPLLTAAGATALIFAALIPSRFPGFAELGLIAASGVLCVALATLLLQPVLVRLLPFEARPGSAPPLPDPAPPRRGLALAVAAIALATAGAGALSARTLPFDYDALALLPKDSEAAGWQRRMLAESDFNAELVILTDPDPQALAARAAAARALPEVSKVQGVEAFFPEDAPARAAAARAIGAALAEAPGRAALEALLAASWDAPAEAAAGRLLAALAEALEDGQEQAFAAGQRPLVDALQRALTALKALQAARNSPEAPPRSAAFVGAWARAGQATLRTLLAWRDARPPAPADLPPALRDRFVGADGALAAYVFPRHSIYDRVKLDALLDGVLAVDPQATGLPTTHRVFSDLVVQAFTQGTALALALALLWIGLVLRRPRAILLASVPLIIGGAWMLGGLRVLGVDFNFANIIALPLVMGLAVDYGVWFAHQADAHPRLTGGQVARLAGRPILLAAATTLAGLGAITLASYQGVASMGQALTLGLLACVIATLGLAPAIANLRPRR